MKKQLLIAIGMLVCFSMYSQGVLTPLKEWSTTIGTQHFFYKNVVVTDASDNVYVAGATVNGAGNYDILVAKYDRRGDLEWTQQIDGAANFHDFATALFVNDSAVYVTGTISDTSIWNSDIVTLKLRITDGAITWQETFDGTGSLYDCGTDIIVSDSGFVYVTGTGFNALAEKDYISLRYNAVGTLIWSNVYDYQGENDAGIKITTSSGGSSVFVLGIGQTSLDTTDYDAVTIRLNKFTGAWVSTAVGSGGSSDVYQVNDLTQDNIDRSFYIAGVVDNGVSDDMYVAKLDSNLVFQWEATYDGSDNLDDMANGVRVDGAGNVYLAGFVTSSSERKNWILIQYDNTGSQQWVEEYNDVLDGDDEAMSMELDANDNPIVTGYDSTELNQLDYFTVKYDNTGAVIWNIRESSMAGKDKALNMVINDDKSIIITGESQKPDGSYEYKTVKYYEHNTITPTDFNEELGSSSFLYYENKGQLLDTDMDLASQLRFYTNSSFPNYYFMNDTVSFVFNQIDTIPATVDTMHRIDMVFRQSNVDKKITLWKKMPVI